jgi:hypothetical protein
MLITQTWGDQMTDTLGQIRALKRAVLIEQADGNAELGGPDGVPVAQPCPSAAWRRLASGTAGRDPVDQWNVAVPESAKVGLPQDRDVTDGIVATRGNKAGTLWSLHDRPDISARRPHLRSLTHSMRNWMDASS